MTDEKIKDLIRTLKSDDSVFIGIVGQNINGTDVNIMANISDPNIINSFLIEALADRLLESIGVDSLIQLNDEDVNTFAESILDSFKRIVSKKMKELSKTVDSNNPVNVIKTDFKNSSAAIAIDISDLEKLKGNDFFNSMPDEIKNAVLKQAKEVGKRNAK